MNPTSLISFNKVAAACVSLSSMIAGCGAPRVVPNPSEITLENALHEVGRGLAKLHAERPAGSDFGLYPAEITITFNVTAGGTNNSKLVIAPFSGDMLNTTFGRMSGEWGVEETAERGNTVSVKFVNLLFAPAGTLIHETTGQELRSKLVALAGFDPSNPPIGHDSSVDDETAGSKATTPVQDHSKSPSKAPDLAVTGPTPSPPVQAPSTFPPKPPDLPVVQPRPSPPNQPVPEQPPDPADEPATTPTPPAKFSGPVSIFQEDFDNLDQAQLLQLFEYLRQRGVNFGLVRPRSLTTSELRGTIVEAVNSIPVESEATRVFEQALNAVRGRRQR